MGTPRSIGRYEILNRIGAGGMGALYLGRDPNINRLVAIKLLLHADLERPEDRERFAREARAGGALSHPNIVTVFDYGEFDGAPFLVMEYIRGETLRELIKRNAPYTLSQKLVFLEQLCSGLAFAHDAGVIHRDIKPANLMVDSLNLLKILDFGVARMAESGVTIGSGPVGTPGYMSPEQIQGRTLDGRSDLFAAGAVAYEFLTHRAAFTGESQHTIMHKVLHEDPVPILSVSPEVGPEIAAVLGRVLQKDPAKRFQNAASLQDAFRTVRENLGPDRQSGPRSAPSGRGSGSQATPSRRTEDLVQDARLALSAGEYADAMRLADQVLAGDPGHPDAKDVRQRAQQKSDAARVHELLERAQEDLADKRLTDADNWISKALEIQPHSGAAFRLRSQVESRRLEMEGRATGRISVKAACDRAWRYLEAGALEAARRATDEAMALDPLDAEVLRLRDTVSAAANAAEHETVAHGKGQPDAGSPPRTPPVTPLKTPVPTTPPYIEPPVGARGANTPIIRSVIGGGMSLPDEETVARTPSGARPAPKPEDPPTIPAKPAPVRDEPIISPPPLSLAEPQPAPSRKPVIYIAGGLVAVAAIVIVAFNLGSGQPPAQQPDQAPSATTTPGKTEAVPQPPPPVVPPPQQTATPDAGRGGMAEVVPAPAAAPAPPPAAPASVPAPPATGRGTSDPAGGPPPAITMRAVLQRQARELKDQAIKMLEKRDLVGAEMKIEQVLSKLPDDDEAKQLRAKIAIEKVKAGRGGGQG